MALQNDEDRRRQRQKNIAVAAVLAGLVVLFYLVTVVKLTSNLQ